MTSTCHGGRKSCLLQTERYLSDPHVSLERLASSLPSPVKPSPSRLETSRVMVFSLVTGLLGWTGASQMSQRAVHTSL